MLHKKRARKSGNFVGMMTVLDPRLRGDDEEGRGDDRIERRDDRIEHGDDTGEYEDDLGVVWG